MTTASLGRLEQVDLGEAWANEAGHFTPWLASEDNLALLGETIGIDLELVGQEKDVGPFRADILCRDTATDAFVLIENQLERTDHTHLGQLLTYAAGLQAVTIVWIAREFRDEHRATLDWLNQITDEQFNFFGLEIELWRIADSPIAPKFNFVCKPNGWTRTAPGTEGESGPRAFSELKQLQKEYWCELWKYLREHHSHLKGAKPRPQHWNNFSIGRSKFKMHTAVNTQEGFISAGVTMHGPTAKTFFNALLQEKADIERELGEPLEWEELPHRVESRMRFRLANVDPTDRHDWPRQIQWLAAKLEALHRVFAPRIKNLDSGGQDDEEGDQPA